MRLCTSVRVYMCAFVCVLVWVQMYGKGREGGVRNFVKFVKFWYMWMISWLSFIEAPRKGSNAKALPCALNANHVRPKDVLTTNIFHNNPLVHVQQWSKAMGQFCRTRACQPAIGQGQAL